MKGRKRINHFYVFGMSSLAFGGSSFLGETSLGPYQEFWKKKKKKGILFWGRMVYSWSAYCAFKSRCQVCTWMCKLIVKDKRIRVGYLKLVVGNLKNIILEVAQTLEFVFLKCRRRLSFTHFPFYRKNVPLTISSEN